MLKQKPDPNLPTSINFTCLTHYITSLSAINCKVCLLYLLKQHWSLKRN